MIKKLRPAQPQQLSNKGGEARYDVRNNFTECNEGLIALSVLQEISEHNNINLALERYVEITEGDAICTTTTSLLHQELGMSGVVLDAKSNLMRAVRNLRNDEIVKPPIFDQRKPLQKSLEHTANSANFEAERLPGAVAPTLQANTLLENPFGEKKPIFLSIAAEDSNLDLLKDTNLKIWRPQLVQVKVADHGGDEKASLISCFMESVSYRLVAQTDVFHIYVDVSGKWGHQPTKNFIHDQNDLVPKGAPQIGVVMRTKDRAALLRRALESIRNQTWDNWQLVVVNDGGEMEPVDRLVDKIFAGDCRVKILHRSECKGMEAASNAGIRRLTSDYALIHDDDDSLAPEFMSSMIAAISRQREKHPNIKGIACRVNVVHEDVIGNEIIIDRIEEFKAQLSEDFTEGFLNIQDMLRCNQFPPIAFMFDLASARALGAFDEDLPVLGDWDFHTRFVLKHDIWMHDEYLSFYHLRGAAAGAAGNTVVAQVGRHRLYSKKLRNNWIRRSSSSSDCDMIGIAIASETQALIRSEFQHIHYRLSRLEEWSMDDSRAKKGAWRRKWKRWKLRRNISSLYKKIKANYNRSNSKA